MSPTPARPKIYHITHVDNLSRVIADGGLLSDASMIQRGGPPQAIGMSGIKRRRVEDLQVACHPGTMVGDFVPFYFCPRSVMLYVIHCANHPELTYRGGQVPIIHLEADLHESVRWAVDNAVPWAFSLANAGARYTEFRSELANLDELDWNAIAATDFRSSEVKEKKQAEFLLHGSFPFTLIERIGVCNLAVSNRVHEALAQARHRPVVDIIPAWYF
jgi:ssDNA thymidine ADP-ribosyltransferase, DarT